MKVKGYNYHVSENGEVYRVETGYEIKQVINSSGYLTVRLWKDNKPEIKTVHRLVALAYIPNPENKPCVNHINGVKTDNRVGNLEWVTYSQNTLHSYQMGLQEKIKGVDCYQAKYTEDFIHCVCRLMEQGFRNVEILDKLEFKDKDLLKNIRNHDKWEVISSQYNIPKKSRILSEESIKWICERLEEGYRICDIVNMSNNPRIKKDVVRKIKIRELYSDSSKGYKF